MSQKMRLSTAWDFVKIVLNKNSVLYKEVKLIDRSQSFEDGKIIVNTKHFFLRILLFHVTNVTNQITFLLPLVI